MEASERSDFGAYAESIARSHYQATVKYESNGVVAGVWEDLPPEVRARLIAVAKKLLVEDIIEPGKAALPDSEE